MTNPTYLASGAIDLMERMQAENDTKSAQEIVLDNSNTVKFPGFPYTFEALNEKILVSIDIFKSGYECKNCKGSGKIETKAGREMLVETCSACNGRGGLLVLPEGSKNLPTTGVVVSMGPVARKNATFKIGDRILFGAYAGTMIPTKAGLMFKYMDWYLAVIKIEGADEMSAFDFIINVEE